MGQLTAQPKQVKSRAAYPVNGELDRPMQGNKDSPGTVLPLHQGRLMGEGSKQMGMLQLIRADNAHFQQEISQAGDQHFW